MNLGEDNSGFIQKLFLRHVWPSVAAQVISTVGPIVSSAIAGIVFGQTGLAMNGLFSPFFFLAGFFGTVVASGSTAVAARYIAKDDDRRIAGIYTLALVLASGLALLLCLAMTLLREPVVAVLAGGELLEPARRYYAPTVWYMFFTVVVYVPLFWARLAGRPSVALALTLTMAGANIGLAVLFTAVVGLGLEYLAVSQALSTALALSVALIMLHRRKNGLRLAKPIHIAQDITALALAGSPLGLSRLYRFASVFLLNILLLSAVGPGAVAVYSVLNSLLRFVTAFANGVSGVQMPIAGVLLEERDTVSLKLLARVMLRYGNAVIFAVAALMAVFREPVAAAFGMGGDMFFTALLCFCAYLPFYLNGSLFVSWYTAIRQVGLANIVTLAQDMALPLIFAAALSGGGWLWLHLPLAGVALALLLPPLLLHMSKTGLSVPLLLDTRARGPALAFSVERESAKASDASAAVDDFCREIGLQKRQAMLMSLAVEEMVTLIGNHDAAGGNISIRLTQFNGSTVLRLRDNGRKFNPIDYYNSRLNESEDFEDSVDLLGVKYIVGAAKVVYYRETFGVNNLVIII